MVRSDWSKKWTTDPVKAVALAADPVFPGVSLEAIQFLQLKRHILFHGHEPLDTDTTPTLEGEAWLMHHGYTQAEGVDNLDAVPETGCLINIGYPRFSGGLGGYARYIAICPPSTKGAEDLTRRRAAQADRHRCTSTRRPGRASVESSLRRSASWGSSGRRHGAHAVLADGRVGVADHLDGSCRHPLVGDLGQHLRERLRRLRAGDAVLAVDDEERHAVDAIRARLVDVGVDVVQVLVGLQRAQRVLAVEPDLRRRGRRDPPRGRRAGPRRSTPAAAAPSSRAACRAPWRSGSTGAPGPCSCAAARRSRTRARRPWRSRSHARASA